MGDTKTKWVTPGMLRPMANGARGLWSLVFGGLLLATGALLMFNLLLKSRGESVVSTDPLAPNPDGESFPSGRQSSPDPTPLPQPTEAPVWPTGSMWPPLEAPASRADVKAGRAIFSLAGMGIVQRVPLPHRPIDAWWLAPRDQLVRGKIWQAERLARLGQHQVFCGLVTADGPIMVPADRLLLRPAGLDQPPARCGSAGQVGVLLSVAGPGGISITLINLGLDPRPAPETLTAPGPKNEPSFIEGLDLRLRCPDLPQPSIPAKSGPSPSQASLSLSPLAPLEQRAWHLELDRHYLLPPPGCRALQAELRSLPGLGPIEPPAWLDLPGAP